MSPYSLGLSDSRLRSGLDHQRQLGAGNAALAAQRLYATADGGTTWSTITPEPPLPGFASLDFASRGYGWAIAGNAFDYTADGGKSWKPLTKQ